MAEMGMELPTRSAVSSAAVMVAFASAGESFEPGAGIDSAAERTLNTKSKARTTDKKTTRWQTWIKMYICLLKYRKKIWETPGETDRQRLAE